MFTELADSLRIGINGFLTFALKFGQKSGEVDKIL